MATTSYGVNNNLAVKLWAKKLFQEALKETYFSRFTGKSSNSLVHIKDDLTKSAGDRIRVGLRMQLTGDGVQGDGTLEGNEEALVTYTDDVFIDQLRHAVRSGGKMSEQRVPFSVREEAKNGLKDWFAGRLDTCFFNQLCGYTVQTDTRYTGNQAAIAPSSGNKIFAGSTATDVGQTSTDKMTLSLIDRAVETAKLMTPMIRPVKVNGEDKYVFFMHEYQATDLRLNTSTGDWKDLQMRAIEGGKTKDNGLYTGALGEYGGAILHASSRVTQGVNGSSAVTTTRRAVLCGAQALLLAYGGKNGDEGGSEEMSWVEELFDYQNQLGVAAGMQFGMKKTQFNSADFATIVCSTYAAAHT